MLLLITASIDGTSDRIVSRLGEGVFRLNYDLWRDYKLEYTPDFWRVVSPTGREITSSTVTGVFWWKPLTALIGDDRLVKSEVKYILRDLYGWAITRGLAKGNSPDFHNKFGKMNLLWRAKNYFKIPESLVTWQMQGGQRFIGCDTVVKSLSSELSDNKNSLMTTRAAVEALDPQYPWFIQSTIESDWDCTVFLCNRRLFAFRRSRIGMKGVDWRVEQDFQFTEQEWFPFSLTPSQTDRLLALSDGIGVEIGRYDFMIDKTDGELTFLEFNATGQWVFLDIHDQYGLVDTVTEWLQPPSK